MMPVRWLTSRSRTRCSACRSSLKWVMKRGSIRINKIRVSSMAGGLRRHELHRGSLHRLGDGPGIAEVILLSFGIAANILRRHQPGIVA